MTKIIFERFGGFLESPIALVLDVNALSPREAKYIMYLIEEADFFRFPEDLVDESAVDEFTYAITIEADSVRHRVHVSAMYLSEPLQLLVDELAALAMSLEYS